MWMPMNEKDKEKLLQYITEVSFALNDVVLFLDTHPEDTEALKYYHNYRCMRDEAMDQYSKHFGPLLNTDVVSENKWIWVCGKWPWEGGC